MSDLNKDQLNIKLTKDGQIVCEPEYVKFLRTQGYPINEIRDVRIVESESRDLAHMVITVETTEYPTNHPSLDVVEHSTTIRVCSCEDYRYNQRIDVSERTLAEGNIGSCKHIVTSHRVEKAKADDNQMGLDYDR